MDDNLSLLFILNTLDNHISIIRTESIWFGQPPKNEQNKEKSIIKYYTYRGVKTEGKRKRTKCIVRPNKTVLFHIHFPLIYDGKILDIEPNKLRINHYYCVSSKKRRGGSNEIFDDSMKKYYDIFC